MKKLLKSVFASTLKVIIGEALNIFILYIIDLVAKDKHLDSDTKEKIFNVLRSIDVDDFVKNEITEK